MKYLACSFLFLGGALSPTVAGEKTLPHIVGHRGLIRHAPENTLAGFAACLELRLGFEVDVRRCKDGRLVCIHDATVDRTTEGMGKVSEFPWPELRKLDAGREFHPDFTGEKVPTLDQVFALLARGGPKGLLALDIKEEGLEEEILLLIRKHGIAKQVVCIGLTIERPELRKNLRKGDNTLGVAVLAQTIKDLPTALKDAAADWVYVRFVPTAAETALVHKQGKRVFIAGPTVAGLEETNWNRCRDVGVDALLTDYPLECRAAASKK